MRIGPGERTGGDPSASQGPRSRIAPGPPGAGTLATGARPQRIGAAGEAEFLEGTSLFLGLLHPLQERRSVEEPEVILGVPDVELPAAGHVLPGQLPLLHRAAPPQTDPALPAVDVEYLRAVARREDVGDVRPQVLVHEDPRADLHPAPLAKVNDGEPLGGDHDHLAQDLLALGPTGGVGAS